ncbi:MAG: iron-siderophore ABC transporter substrate-binding protein [Tolypothrix brevis GSE-NOS-MK-07-07A]|jgi:iron complex transport system substrate-binding protein|nr:iron-siderophore ABC transporter substrate-binding protein [Tolypothrix brevis GSE-NOS-MK-07-07A]
MGETCVPNNPQRVVTLIHHILGHTLSLDVKPVGSDVRSIEQSSGNYLDVQSYLGDKTEGIMVTGIEESPNLERILRLKPDLIFATDYNNQVYSLLSQIAPVVTVPFKDVVFNWKEGFYFIAQVLGKEEKAQQALNHYYQRIEELKISLGDRYQGQTISTAGDSGINTLFALTKGTFSGSILSDLGLQQPEAQNVVTPNGAIYGISEERLELVDGDVLFFLAYGKEGKAIFERLRQRPLWKTLKAVQKGQVYLVNGWTWTGSSILAADAVIDDLYKYLVRSPSPVATVLKVKYDGQRPLLPCGKLKQRSIAVSPTKSPEVRSLFPSSDCVRS